MLNLLGDFWPDETEPPDWTSLLGTEGAVLHLYGKRRAKGLRKMGHVTLLGDDAEDLLTDVRMLKDAWLE
jgi:5-(carboxyamino)imidazole ribonucleotide synthase